MKQLLLPFDQNHPKIEITTQLNNQEHSYYISYTLTGDLGFIDLGNGHPQKNRVIKLWEKTCFELFIKNEQGNYIEFNFSPVFEWNAFYFEQKGNPLSEYAAITEMNIDILLSLEKFELIVEIEKNKLPKELQGPNLSAGITSVIKTKNNQLSYWALSHEDSRPNFHHFGSFRYKF